MPSPLLDDLRAVLDLPDLLALEQIVEHSGFTPDEWLAAIDALAEDRVLVEAGFVAKLKSAVHNVARKVGGAVRGAVQGAKAGWRGGAKDDDEAACGKGYKMVFGKCRKIGGEGDDDKAKGSAPRAVDPDAKTKVTAPAKDSGPRAVDPAAKTQVTAPPKHDGATAHAATHPKDDAKPGDGPRKKLSAAKRKKKAAGKAAPAKPTGKRKASAKSGVQPKKKKAAKREPREGEDDSHMPRAWHKKKAAEYEQLAAHHSQEVSKVWKDDHKQAAHHIVKAMEYDRKVKHHLTHAGRPEKDRKAAQAAQSAAHATRDADARVSRAAAANG